MNHRERTAAIAAENHAALDAVAESGQTYRALAQLLLKQMAWAQDKMERSERLCKDPWDRAHLRTVRQALVFNHPLLKKDRELIMELNPHVTLSAADRKAIPVCTGVLDYFPDALIEVAKVSKVGNDQHNPGQPLHWAKEKSTDEVDALVRHLLDRGKVDADGTRHSAKVAWRALAALQREIDAERAAAPAGATEIYGAEPRTATEVDSLVGTTESFGPKPIEMSMDRLLKLMTGGFKEGEIPTPTAPEGYAIVADGTVQNGDIMLGSGCGQEQWEPTRPSMVLRGADVAQGRTHGTFVARKVWECPPPISFELSPDRIESDYRPLTDEYRVQFGDIIQCVGATITNLFQTASGLIGARANSRIFRPISALPPEEEVKVDEPATDVSDAPKARRARRWRYIMAPKHHTMTTVDKVKLVEQRGSKVRRKWEPVLSLNGYTTTDAGIYQSENCKYLVKAKVLA